MVVNLQKLPCNNIGHLIHWFFVDPQMGELVFGNFIYIYKWTWNNNTNNCLHRNESQCAMNDKPSLHEIFRCVTLQMEIQQAFKLYSTYKMLS